MFGENERKESTVSYTLPKIDQDLYNRFKILCTAKKLSVRRGIIIAMQEFVDNHKGELENFLENFSK